MKTVRIFFADDHQIVIKGILDIFNEFNQHESDRHIEVVGFCDTSAELLNNVNRNDVDVFIIDLGFASTRGDISIINMILEKNQDAKVIVFSMRKNINTIAGCYRSGAKAYVSKGDNVDELMNAIFTVCDGDDYFVPGILDQIGLMSLRNPLGKLDERDAKLFLMLAQDYDMKDVEEELGISEKTIHNIITNKIKPVLGVSRKNFRALALKMGLIEDIE